MQATAIAHPNIALVKYWGKADAASNTPATPSLSVTLDGLRTRTRVVLEDEFESDRVVFNGGLQDPPEARIIECLNRMRAIAATPLRAHIETDNDFPTAAGLASSASGFAALVTALDAALGLGLSPAQRAVQARLSSASAARSMFGGYVVLDGGTSGDWVARPLATAAHWPLAVVVAVCGTGPKAVGSAGGMRRSAGTSPLYARWVETSRGDFVDAVNAVKSRDFERLAERSEMNCLKMHAVMLSSCPPLIYWTGATVECMHVVRQLRSSGVPVFFTIDAGPQLKAFCPPDALQQVRTALGAVTGVQELISAGIGAGARTLSDCTGSSR
jgi:diphosphomevalonate decarboxylase